MKDQELVVETVAPATDTVMSTAPKTDTKDPEKALGKRLQKARKEAGLTQQELCQQANISYSTLAKIERGAIKAPSVFTIQNIAIAINSSLDALMGVSSVSGIQNTKKTSNRGVRFAYFDVNGCLVQFTHYAFTRLSKESGVPVDIIEAIFWDYDDPINRGEKTVDELNQALSMRLNMEVDWMEYYLDTVQPISGMAELLEWVQQHYQIGLLTNTMPGFVEALQARGKIPPVQFDVIIDSSIVGAMKPEAAIYEVAQQKSGVAGSEILFVDDLRSNLIAAKKYGWHTIWFDAYHSEGSIDTIRQALAFGN